MSVNENDWLLCSSQKEFELRATEMIEEFANEAIRTKGYFSFVLAGGNSPKKIYETLCTSEEMRKSKEKDNYYIVPADNRDLNYEKYFQEGNMKKNIEDYNSHNTEQKNIEGIKKLLLKLDFVQQALKK